MNPAAPAVLRYSMPAIVLHWVMALAIVAAFSVGWTMHDMPFSPTRMKLFNWHKWAGVTILALAALRLLWRLRNRPPEELPAPAWQRRSAQIVHTLLYALFFAVPLVGWAYSSAAGFPVVLYGVLPLPDFVPRDRALADALKPLHGWLAWALAAVVVLHVAAALKHHFVDRDQLMLRMLPGRR